MTRSQMTKAERLMGVLEKLQYAECSAQELRRRLGLPESAHRSVQRDLEQLALRGDIERQENGCYRRVARGSTLNPVEALAVYSAARMLFHHASEYNEHYLTALEKLTDQLPERARRVAVIANSAYRQRPNQGVSRTFEMVAQAWLGGVVLRGTYHSLKQTTPIELAIYFIELNPRNREAYAIGVNRLREGATPYVYRLSRLRNLTLLPDTYEVPADFHPMRFLSSAWGIMPGDPIRVELFFSPEVKDRVQETHLGNAAEVRVLSSGHTRVTLSVGGWQELLPWVLGWGGQVEVISPPELLSAVAQAHAKGAAIYTAVPSDG